MRFFSSSAAITPTWFLSGLPPIYIGHAVYPSLIWAFCVFGMYTENPSLPSNSMGPGTGTTERGATKRRRRADENSRFEYLAAVPAEKSTFAPHRPHACLQEGPCGMRGRQSGVGSRVVVIFTYSATADVKRPSQAANWLSKEKYTRPTKTFSLICFLSAEIYCRR